MKSNIFKVLSFFSFTILTLSLCFSCGELTRNSYTTGCATSDLDLDEGYAKAIEEGMQIAGAWRLTVFEHRINCTSDLTLEARKYKYDKLSSNIFYLETSDNKIFYIADDNLSDLEMRDRQIVGEWEVGKPFIINLLLKSDDQLGSLQTTNLAFYIESIDVRPNSDNSLNLLEGTAHYRNIDQTVMIGNFELRKLD